MSVGMISVLIVIAVISGIILSATPGRGKALESTDYPPDYPNYYDRPNDVAHGVYLLSKYPKKEDSVNVNFSQMR